MIHTITRNYTNIKGDVFKLNSLHKNISNAQGIRKYCFSWNTDYGNYSQHRLYDNKATSYFQLTTFKFAQNVSLTSSFYPLSSRCIHSSSIPSSNNTVNKSQYSKFFSNFHLETFVKSFSLPKLVSTEDVLVDSDKDIDPNAVHFSKELRDLLKEASNKHDIIESTLLKPEYFIKEDLELTQKGILEATNVSHPVLQQAASYFFQQSGKMFRPMIILLLSKAIQAHEQQRIAKVSDVIKDENVHMRKLAEVAEIIHVSSLIHDDILDQSDTRRGVKSLHNYMGNKIAVLSGDFLLARASITLAKIGSVEAVKAISTAIEHLVYGEMLQMAKKENNDLYDTYMQTIFFKTASLISNSCKSVGLVTNCPNEVTTAAYEFGKHLGIAYQLIDDVLDFTESGTLLGKPSMGADLRQGIATSPVLFASLEYPELDPLIRRKFANEGDVDHAWKLVSETNAIEKTRDLAITHCKKAVNALMVLEDSSYRAALFGLVLRIMERKK